MGSLCAFCDSRELVEPAERVRATTTPSSQSKPPRRPLSRSPLTHPQADGMAPPLKRIQTHKQGCFTATTCPHCSVPLEYLSPPSQTAPDEFELECAVCRKVWTAKEGRKDGGVAGANGQPQGKRDKPVSGKRKIGTGECCKCSRRAFRELTVPFLGVQMSDHSRPSTTM